jgi:hypothetical protein
VDDTLEYAVEDILDVRVTRGKRMFLVKWEGYPIQEATWEPESNLSNCPKILADFVSRRKL